MTTGGDRPDIAFGRLLHDLRRRAALSQSDAARASGVNQAEISRMESGRSRITAERVEKLLGVYVEAERGPLSEQRRVELVAEARALEARFADRRLHLQTGQPLNFARRTRAAEESAHLVRSYQPLMILGVLQTRDYATAVFGAGDDLGSEEVQRAVRERIKRWDALIADVSREWVLIQTEWAVRAPIGSFALQAAQIEQLIEASERPNVRLGVIPLDTVTPYPVSVTGFHLYDDRELVVGTDVGAALTTAPEHIAAYRERFGLLERIAVFDGCARDLLGRAASSYAERV